MKTTERTEGLECILMTEYQLIMYEGGPTKVQPPSPATSPVLDRNQIENQNKNWFFENVHEINELFMYIAKMGRIHVASVWDYNRCLQVPLLKGSDYT